MSSKAPVSVVILNYNGKRFLKGCLDSVLSQDYPAFEVLLVDNASSDDSVEFVGQDYPAVRIIKSATNLGFAAGNNLGVQEASHDQIVLVNNDVVVEPGWLAALANAIEEPGVGLASSLVWTVGVPKLFYER